MNPGKTAVQRPSAMMKAIGTMGIMIDKSNEVEVETIVEMEVVETVEVETIVEMEVVETVEVETNAGIGTIAENEGIIAENEGMIAVV
jgi:hypothetical protein